MNKDNTRNYGIDLLRIVSMFLIVILHSLGRGGILHGVDSGSTAYKLAWLLEIMAYPAVNIFALISGYVSYSDNEKKINYTNYVMLWLEVVFYGVLISLIFDFWGYPITIRDYFIVMMPVTNNLYWYFTAYTGLFILIPFINNALRVTDNRVLKWLGILIIFIFSMFGTITNVFTLNDGYSVIWLILLFILGGIIKKCRIGINIRNYKIVTGIFLFYLITFCYKIYGFELAFIDIRITNNLFVSYTSPTILMVAILTLIGFSKMNFHKLGTKLIKFAAPSAFSIYIINNHRSIWQYIMEDLFLPISKSSIKVVVYPILFAIGFVIIAILIDKIRLLIFKWLHIKDIVDKIFRKSIKN